MRGLTFWIALQLHGSPVHSSRTESLLVQLSATEMEKQKGAEDVDLELQMEDGAEETDPARKKWAEGDGSMTESMKKALERLKRMAAVQKLTPKLKEVGCER